jgi:alkylresorcinol/alkylpyrone synthase
MMPRPLQLLSLVTHAPTPTLTRDDTLALLPRLAGGPEAAERFRGTVERSRIDTRHVETPLDELEGLGTGDRSRVYERRLRAVAEDLGRRALDAANVGGQDVSAVVTVSCTGYMLPSVDAYIMPRLGISAHARRVPVTELGCSAGVAAIGLATELLQVRGGHGLVISIELCSSCMQTQNVAPSDVIGNILFADAAAAAVVGPGTNHRGPEVLATSTVLWPDTTDALGMWLSDTGLRLVLSPELPAIVGDRIAPTVSGFLAANGVSQSDVGFWVVHPGGPRVLDAVGERLSLSEADVAPSWEVWRSYGNVSSATVFFILQALRARGPIPEGRLGVMMAFGPGLSCELVLLRAGGWLSDTR